MIDLLASVQPPSEEGIWLFHAKSYQAALGKDEILDLREKDIYQELLQHWLNKGCIAGLSPTPRFDVSFYLKTNPDVEAAGIPPWIHWCEHGAEEGRLPHPAFPRELLDGRPGPEAMRAWIEQIGESPPSIDWLEPLWRAALSHEPDLGRLNWQDSLLSNQPFRGTKRALHTTRLRALMPQIQCLALLPGMFVGGAEREASIALRYRAEHFGTEDLLILCTDSDNNQAQDWFNGLGQVYWLNSDPELALDRQESALLVAQIVCGWGPKVVMNFNSGAGWEAMVRWGPQMASRSETYSWLFSRIYGERGEPLGYADQYARQALPWLKSILFDNHTFAKELIDSYLLPSDQAQKLKVLYQPIDQHPPNPPGGTAILWAGRLAAQKRPELLAAAARKLPELRFEVWSPQDFKEEAPNWGLDLPNVFGCGGYLNVDDLPLERYALALFTSAFEGMPNLLLELGACAMPIVASAVGGVPELVQLSTGWAVDTSQGNLEEQADKLVAAIQQVLSNPKEALSRGLALQKLVRKRHNPINYWQTGKQCSSFFRK